MDRWIICDGRLATSTSLNPREQILKDLILQNQEHANILCPDIEHLKNDLEGEPSVVLIHHSKLSEALEQNNIPEHHYYLHYSGAGFESSPTPFSPLPNHIFLSESIDMRDIKSHQGLSALLKTLAETSPTGTTEHWKKNLKNLSLTPFLNSSINLLGDFPNLIAENIWLKHGATQERNTFAQWAKDINLSDQSPIGPLSIEKAWLIYKKKWADTNQVSDQDERLTSTSFPISHGETVDLALAHDLKHLLFQLKQKNFEKLQDLWQNYCEQRLGPYLDTYPEITPLVFQLQDAISHKDETKSLALLKELKKHIQDHRSSSTPYSPLKNEGVDSSRIHERNIVNDDMAKKDHSMDGNKNNRGSSLGARDFEGSAHQPLVWSVGPNRNLGHLLQSTIFSNHGISSHSLPNIHRHDTYEHLSHLLEELRNLPQKSLFHTMLIVDVGPKVEDALNAGHHQPSLSPLANWTHDHKLQLGIITRIILTFPQICITVVHDLEEIELKKLIQDSLLSSVPSEILAQENMRGSNAKQLLEHLIQHHFFHRHELASKPEGLNDAVQKFYHGRRMLFDPSGLRTLIKCRFIANIFAGSTSTHLPNLDHTHEQRKVISSRLNHLLVSVDEDMSSTLLHAYAGYRFGYRAWTITSFQQFDDPDIWSSPAHHKKVIRDTDLRFPDIDGREPFRPSHSMDSQPTVQQNVRQRLESIYSDLWQHCSQKDQQGQHLPKVNRDWNVRSIAAGGSNIRIKAWTGASSDEKKWGEIQSGKSTQSSTHHLLGLRKPLRSLFDLGQIIKEDEHENLMTIASRLVPPKRLEEKQGHFAPYVNLPLAAELLAQAKTLDEDDELDWLIGAVLALEADEMLLGMSEYTGLEAVRWLHRCEVRAEIRSVGFSGMIHIRPRKQELNHLVKTRYENDEISQHHFLSRLWDDLRTLYKSAEQFHAAEEANIESFCKRKWLPNIKGISSLEEMMRRMFIMSASSIWTWGASLFLSTVLLCILYMISLPTGAETSLLSFQVLISSLIGEPALGLEQLTVTEHLNIGLKLTIMLHYGTSYILFGFFLSMIYRRLTRS